MSRIDKCDDFHETDGCHIFESNRFLKECSNYCGNYITNYWGGLLSVCLYVEQFMVYETRFLDY